MNIHTPIHFAHGNGFPAATYRQLFKVLGNKYSLNYIDLLGHHLHYPVTENWQHLVRELKDHILHHFQEPVIGIGHSLGGVLTYFAAIEQPELFKMVILLDSPLFGPFKSALIKWGRRLGFLDYFTPAWATRRRRRFWPDNAAALAYLRRHKLFRKFDEACLQDYVHYGMQKTEKGLYLKFSPEIEYKIFHHFPYHFPQSRGKLQVPAAFLYGKQSKVVTAYDCAVMHKYYALPLYEVPGTHLFPFEYPGQTGKTIIKVIDALANKHKISL